MGKVFYPCVFHVRCDAAMRDEVKARGGGHWLRSLVQANSRPPAADVPFDGPYVSPAIASGTQAGVSPKKQRATKSKPRGRTGKGRVSLDKGKRRRVKSDV